MGLARLDEWTGEDKELFNNNPKYYFQGDTHTWKECYDKLVGLEIIPEEKRYKNNSLMWLKNLENLLGCSAMCKKPRFWFYKIFYSAPHDHTCLTQLHKAIESDSGTLRVFLILMFCLCVLMLCTLPGICSAKDRCFKEIRKPIGPKSEEEN